MKRRMMMGVKDLGIDKDTAPNGVYILHTNDKLYTLDVWNTANNANAAGVAVLADDCRFVMGLVRNASALRWSKDQVSVSGITITSEYDIAKSDFKGLQNTDAWVAHYGLSTSYAAGWCRNHTFKNGKKGYLGALGEWYEAYKNKAEVDACMVAVGSTGLGTNSYWASTQDSVPYAYTLGWSDGRLNFASKNESPGRMVRAFCEL